MPVVRSRQVGGKSIAGFPIPAVSLRVIRSQNRMLQAFELRGYQSLNGDRPVRSYCLLASVADAIRPEWSSPSLKSALRLVDLDAARLTALGCA